jgi:hypothetical protein
VRDVCRAAPWPELGEEEAGPVRERKGGERGAGSGSSKGERLRWEDQERKRKEARGRKEAGGGGWTAKCPGGCRGEP